MSISICLGSANNITHEISVIDAARIVDFFEEKGLDSTLLQQTNKLRQNYFHPTCGEGSFLVSWADYQTYLSGVDDVLIAFYRSNEISGPNVLPCWRIRVKIIGYQKLDIANSTNDDNGLCIVKTSGSALYRLDEGSPTGPGWNLIWYDKVSTSGAPVGLSSTARGATSNSTTAIDILNEIAASEGFTVQDQTAGAVLSATVYNVFTNGKTNLEVLQEIVRAFGLYVVIDPDFAVDYTNGQFLPVNVDPTIIRIVERVNSDTELAPAYRFITDVNAMDPQAPIENNYQISYPHIAGIADNQTSDVIPPLVTYYDGLPEPGLNRTAYFPYAFLKPGEDPVFDAPVEVINLASRLNLTSGKDAGPKMVREQNFNVPGPSVEWEWGVDSDGPYTVSMTDLYPILTPPPIPHSTQSIGLFKFTANSDSEASGSLQTTNCTIQVGKNLDESAGTFPVLSTNSVTNGTTGLGIRIGLYRYMLQATEGSNSIPNMLASYKNFGSTVQDDEDPPWIAGTDLYPTGTVVPTEFYDFGGNQDQPNPTEIKDVHVLWQGAIDTGRGFAVRHDSVWRTLITNQFSPIVRFILGRAHVDYGADSGGYKYYGSASNNTLGTVWVGLHPAKDWRNNAITLPASQPWWEGSLDDTPLPFSFFKARLFYPMGGMVNELETIRIYNPNGLWAPEGALCYAIWTGANKTYDEPIYETILARPDFEIFAVTPTAKLAFASAGADFGVSTASINADLTGTFVDDGYTLWTTGIDPNPETVVAYNGIGLAGGNSQKLLLSFNPTDVKWQIIAKAPSQATVVTQLRINGYDIEYKDRNLYVLYADPESAWKLLADGDVCS